MSETGDCLGICFSENQLLYSVNDLTERNRIKHIGSIDFNFDLSGILSGESPEYLHGIQQSLTSLRQTYSIDCVRMLAPAKLECWSTFPRLVYETSDERDDHLAVLMQGTPRSDLITTWYSLSNQDYKLLMIRSKQLADRIRGLLTGFRQTDILSDFEIGSEWQQHTNVNGSYLTLHCFTDHISITSYLLGKLRGTTYIDFETVDDLPFLWNYYSQHLSWMNGFHEQIYIYGPAADEVSEVIAPVLKDFGKPIMLNNLDSMNVTAEENTYGFKLESAFPAILLSLNLSDQKQVSEMR